MDSISGMIHEYAVRPGAGRRSHFPRTTAV